MILVRLFSTAAVICLSCFLSTYALNTNIKSLDYSKTFEYGREFILAIPQLYKIGPNDNMADITFMTFENEVSVTTINPLSIFERETNYQEKIFAISKSSPGIWKISGSHNMITKNSTGHAIKIIASDKIAVYVHLKMKYKGKKLSDMYMLPPIHSYEYLFIVCLQGLQSFVLTLAAHDHTIVTYNFKKYKDDFYAGKCEWNATCTNAKPTTLVLNATTFSYFGNGKRDLTPRGLRGFGLRLGGTTIKGSRPILVIGGILSGLTATVLCRQSQLSKKFILFSCGKDTTVCSNTSETFKAKLIGTSPHETTIYNPVKKITMSNSYNISHVLLSGTENYGLIVTTEPVSVTVYAISHFNPRNNMWFTFSSSLGPLNTWSNFAIFKHPKEIYKGQIYLLHIVVSHINSETIDLIYNDKPLSNCKWIDVLNPIFPFSYCTKLITDYQVKLIRKDVNKKFMAIVTLAPGVNKNNNDPFTSMAMSLTNAYVLREPRENCRPQKQTMFKGDGINNDCDELIDEELFNGVDDDGDSFIDEDLMPGRKQGLWGQWTPWFCVGTCTSDSLQTRMRTCDQPMQVNKGGACQGDGIEKSTVTCQPKCLHSEECRLGYYGADCLNKCPIGCSSGLCRVKDGQCFSCKNYSSSAFCSPSLFEKLIKDESVPPLSPLRLFNTLIWILLALVLLLLVICLIYLLERRRKEINTQSPIEKTSQNTAEIDKPALQAPDDDSITHDPIDLPKVEQYPNVERLTIVTQQRRKPRKIELYPDVSNSIVHSTDSRSWSRSHYESSIPEDT